MKLRSLLILSTLVVLFASCGNKGGKSGLLVPKDAGFVMHINSSSLSSKLSWDEIRQTNWFKEMSKEATDSLAQQLLADPSISGIDTKKDFVIYMKNQGRGGYLVVEGSLTDAAAYEKLLIQVHKKEEKQIEIKKEGEFTYVEGEKSVVIWNKSMFAIVGNAPTGGDMTSRFMKNGSKGNNEFEADSLRIFGKQALTLEGSDNLDTDSRFADMIKDGSDMHMWFDIGKFYSGMGNAMLSMMKIDVLLEDNIMAASVNFDNGKITAKSKHYYGDEMKKILANNRPEPISADVINRIPSTDVVGVVAFNYSPTGLKEILKITGLDAMANMFLAKVDFSIDEFVKANKGEVLIAFSDPNYTSKEDTVKQKSGNMTMGHKSSFDMKVLFATSVKDKIAFEKMVTLVWDMSKQMGRRGNDTGSAGIPGIKYKLENNWFAVSNSADHADKFLAGGNNKFPFTDKIAGHPIGLYIDLQKIMRFTGSMIKQDSSGNKKAALDASLNMWQDITAKGGDFKNNASEFEFEINLVDKNTNSLKQLNQYMDKMSVLKDEMKKLNAKKGTVIDIEVPNPPAEVK